MQAETLSLTRTNTVSDRHVFLTFSGDLRRVFSMKLMSILNPFFVIRTCFESDQMEII